MKYKTSILLFLFFVSGCVEIVDSYVDWEGGYPIVTFEDGDIVCQLRLTDFGHMLYGLYPPDTSLLDWETIKRGDNRFVGGTVEFLGETVLLLIRHREISSEEKVLLLAIEESSLPVLSYFIES